MARTPDGSRHCGGRWTRGEHFVGVGQGDHQRGIAPDRLTEPSRLCIPQKSGPECAGRPTHRGSLHRCAAVQYPPIALLQKRVVGQIQHMVALVVGQVLLIISKCGRKSISCRNLSLLIVKWVSAMPPQPWRSRPFIMNVAGPHDWRRLIAPTALAVWATSNSALATRGCPKTRKAA
jgi:hypothetical protein